MKKRFLSKFLKINAVIALLITSFNLTVITSVKALPSNITGEQILARAKTYDAWDYWSVGTCTGFVTRVLDDLGIADAVVGSMVGTSARYSPDQMLANARANPQEAKLIYEGAASGAYNAGVKNGDLVIATASDMGSSFGHVGFIEIRKGVAGWYGANNAVTSFQLTPW